MQPKALVSKQVLLINAISGVVARVLYVAAFAWVIKYLIDRAPDDEVALLPVVLSVTFLMPVLQSVLTAGLARFVTDAYAKGDHERITQIVSTLFPWLVGASLTILAAGAFLTWRLEWFIDVAEGLEGQARVMVFLVFLRLAVAVVLSGFTTGLFALQRFVVTDVVDTAGSVLRILLTVGFLLAFGAEVQWVIVAQVASQIAANLTVAVISTRALPAVAPRRGAYRRELARAVIGYGGWYSIGQLATSLRRAMDSPLLYWLTTPVAVNTFFIGSFFETQIRDLLSRALRPLLPVMTVMHAHGQSDRLVNAYIRGGRLATWGSMLVATPLIVFGDGLLRVYLGGEYEKYSEASHVMLLLLLGFLITFPTTMLFQLTSASARLNGITLSVLAAQLVNILLTIILVGPAGMGATGAALATLLTFSVYHPAVLWPMAVRMFGVPWRRFLLETLALGLAPTPCAIAFAASLQYAFHPTGIVGLLLSCVATAIVYSAVVYVCMLSADRTDLQRVLSVGRRVAAEWR